MTKVTKEMINAAHDVTMKSKLMLGHQLLENIYLAMDSQRTWVGLDFDTIEDCFGDGGYSTEENGILVSAQWLHDFAYAIEAKLKEKNT